MTEPLRAHPFPAGMENSRRLLNVVEKFIDINRGITDYFAEQAAPDLLGRMDGNYSDPAICIGHNEMAAPLPHLLKSEGPPCSDHCPAREGSKVGHTSDLDSLYLDEGRPRSPVRCGLEVCPDSFLNSDSEFHERSCLRMAPR